MNAILSMSFAGEVTWTVFLFIVGLVLIIKGGDWFVDSACKIAELSGIPQFVIGATIVSIGTTLPELITSAIAASKGNVDIAIGNAVGSVNANIGLIMAISLLFLPHAFDKKAYLFKGLTMVFSTIILFLLCLNGGLNAWVSIVLLVVFIIFMTENIIVGKKEAQKIKEVDDNSLKPAVFDVDNPENNVVNEKSDTTPDKKNKVKIVIKSIIMFILGTAFIVGGAQHLVKYGSQLAGYMKIPERVIAITIVAIGTSLPELVTTITSIAKKKHDLSIGNIIGANIIDLCLILPICAIITGGILPVSTKSLYIDLPFCMAFALLAIIPAICTKKFSRAQGGVIMAAYLSYIVLSIVPLNI